MANRPGDGKPLKHKILVAMPAYNEKKYIGNLVLKASQYADEVLVIDDGSTLNPLRHGLEVLFRIMAMISERRPLFFFGLGGSILTIVGILVGIRVLWGLSVGDTLPVGTALISALFIIIGIFSIFTGIILHVLVRRS